ncbi:hypothetical protein C6P45_004303 [Maudiozyma exigua]|uniref:Uncharacterized protein n=1 Tax=Maudiozyma exigua TaxID=34358 RepID=A0A9P6WC26_MAUEX|nr:hypothetical protein C6P45_004303 [Kazachstania exigua]
MRKAYFHIFSRLSKSENEELRSTLKFLTGGNKATSALSSFFSNNQKSLTNSLNDTQLSNNNNNNNNNTSEDTKYINTIVKLLNTNLTKHEKNELRIRKHYDIFYKNLRDVLELTSSTAVSNQYPNTNITSKDMLNQIILSELTETFDIYKVSKIILSKKFHHFDELLDNISLFPINERLQISLLIYYRTKKLDIKQKYFQDWIKQLDNFKPSIQRVFWRCLYHKMNIENSKKDIYDTIVQIGNWNPNKIITLYQSLFEIANLLPNQNKLTINQNLFVITLRTLAPYKDFRSHMIKIVKLSLDCKLVNEKPLDPSVTQQADITNITSQYKFAISLNLILHEIYNNCLSSQNKQNNSIIPELEDIFKIINNEEKDIKSQLSIRYT